MNVFNGYSLITPDNLHWRPSNLMRIPNADFLERTGSENLGARLWRLPPMSANTLHPPNDEFLPSRPPATTINHDSTEEENGLLLPSLHQHRAVPGQRNSFERWQFDRLPVLPGCSILMRLTDYHATAANLLSALVTELTGTYSNGKVSAQPVSSTGRRGRPHKTP